MYADFQTWKAIEDFQSLILDRQANRICELILKSHKNSNLKIEDIGCGSGKLALAISLILKKNNFSLDYLGLDLDPNAILLSKNKWNLTKEKFKLITCDALQTKSCDTNVIISLSNTLLSLGTYESIESFLKVRSRSKTKTYAIFSVSPWDLSRKLYYQSLTKWTPYSTSNGSSKFKLKLTTSKIKEQISILQKMTIQNSNNNTYNVTHKFIGMSCSQISNLLKKTGWRILGWTHPFTDQYIDPMQHEVPEFLIHCENKL